MKEVILIQSLACARFFLGKKSGWAPDALWISTDVQADELLREAGVRPVSAESYWSRVSAEEQLAWQEEVKSLMTSWHRFLPPARLGALSQHLSSFASRELGYYFLAVFRTRLFLKTLLTAEGACRIHFVQNKIAAHFRPPLRCGKQDAPILQALDSLRSEYPNETRVYETEVRNRNGQGAVWAKLAARCLRAILKKFKTPRSADVLLSGNPSLLKPVLDALERKGFKGSFIRFATTLRELAGSLVSERICVLESWDFDRRPKRFDADALWKDLADTAVFERRGIDFLPLFREKLSAFFKWYLPFYESVYNEVHVLLKAIKPRAVAVDEDVVCWNRMLVLAAAELGIPTCVVQHGLPVTFFGFMPLVADHVAVWGSLSRDAYRQWGIADGRLTITGCPKYDAYQPVPTVDRSLKARMIETWEWSADKPTVIFTPPRIRKTSDFEREYQDTPPEVIIRMKRAFFEAARRYPNVQVICKFHPGGWDEAFYGRLSREWGGLPPNFRWVVKGVAAQYQCISDLAFNSTSSACLEALIQKRPYVHMNFKGNALEEMPYPEYAAKTIRNAEELFEIFESLQNGKLPAAEWAQIQERMIAPFVHSRDGRSAQRTAEQITRLIQSRLNPRTPDASHISPAIAV